MAAYALIETQSQPEAIADAVHSNGMMMRGAEKQHTTTATGAFLGECRDNTQLRNEIIAAINARQA